MYLAQSSDTSYTKIPFYIDIFEKIISGHDFKEKSDIDTAINQAKEIAEENKSIYTIDNNHFFLITTLLTKYKKELLQLNKDEDIKPRIYTEIIEILK